LTADTVAVAFNVGQPLEHNKRETFANRDPVCGIERAAPLGERLGLAEAQKAERALHRVGTAYDHEVTVAGLQFVDREVAGRKRGRTGGIDGKVYAVKVEAVGDASGGDVQQNSEAVLGQSAPVHHLGRHGSKNWKAARRP
jgi:hypothetical protein